jgi:hypothetical protein
MAGFIVHFQRCSSQAGIDRAPGEWSETEGAAIMIPDSQTFSDKYQWSVEDDVLLVVEVDEDSGKRKNIAAFAHWDRVVPTEKTD